MSRISIIGSGGMAAAIGSLAVPCAVVVDVLERYGDALAGALLVDVTNPIDADRTGFVTPADSFGAREVVLAAPADAVVVKAFNTQIAHVPAAGPVEGDPVDVFLAGDDPEAKARVATFVESLGLRPLDTGLLPMARTLEHVALLTLGLVTHSVHHLDFSLGLNLRG